MDIDVGLAVNHRLKEILNGPSLQRACQVAGYNRAHPIPCLSKKGIPAFLGGHDSFAFLGVSLWVAADAGIVADSVVATSQPLATQTGVAVMRAGGNAVDAALAAAIALTVMEPTSLTSFSIDRQAV